MRSATVLIRAEAKAVEPLVITPNKEREPAHGTGVRSVSSKPWAACDSTLKVRRKTANTADITLSVGAGRVV